MMYDELPFPLVAVSYYVVQRDDDGEEGPRLVLSLQLEDGSTRRMWWPVKHLIEQSCEVEPAITLQ